jgi:3-hydroxyisobutyrate dehydrogenase
MTTSTGLRGLTMQLSSAPPWGQGIERCMRFAPDYGLVFVDPPVLGTNQPAQEGKLVILASGPDELGDRI